MAGTHPQASAVKAVIADALRPLSRAQYELEVEVQSYEDQPPDTTLWIRPRSVAACPFTVDVGEADIYLDIAVGRGGHIEIDVGDERTFEEGLRRLERIVDAIRRGEVTETVRTTPEGEVVESDVTIGVGEKQMRTNTLWGSTKDASTVTAIDYEPYT